MCACAAALRALVSLPPVINLYTNKCVRVIGKVRKTEYLYPSLVPRLMWEGRVEIASSQSSFPLSPCAETRNELWDKASSTLPSHLHSHLFPSLPSHMHLSLSPPHLTAGGEC